MRSTTPLENLEWLSIARNVTSMLIVSKHLKNFAGHWAANTVSDEVVSWLPIVHLPHGIGHPRDPEPWGPWVVLVTASAGAAHSHCEEDCADKVNGDEGEQHEEHGAEVNTGESAGNWGKRPLKPTEQGGKDRVWRKMTH